MGISTEQAWQTFHEPLRHFIHKRVADRQSAEDLLQEIFLKIHMHIGTLRDEEKLQSWVYQIARNVITDYYRQKAPLYPLENTTLSVLVADIPEVNIEAELAPSLTAMLACLPQPYQEALRLTEFEGLTQKELAVRLNLSFSGAKSRVQRAREKLKQALLDCCHFEFDRYGQIIDYQPKCSCCTANPSCS